MSQDLHQIEVNGLWKVFGDKPERALEPQYASKSRTEIQEELGAVVALRDVSFNVDVGQIFVVMGLSGSGKSTLIRCLIRLIESTQGHIKFDGEDVLEYSPERLTQFRREKVAMVFQHFGLLPHRQVMDNVAYGLEVRGMDKEERYKFASEAIETVGLKGWERYYPNEMSGGMQQRVGLARALAVNPEVLLMDEPFSGLDPLIRREMQDELMSLQTELHKTIVFITHDLDEALKLGDKIVILRDGAIVQEGTPGEIVTDPVDDYVTAFVQDVSPAKVLEAQSIMNPEVLTVQSEDRCGSALSAMRGEDRASAFVVSGDGALLGMITDSVLEGLVQRNALSINGFYRPVTSVDPDTYLREVVPIAAETEHPIPVVDDGGQVVGEVDRTALLSGISEGGMSGNGAGNEQES